MFTDRSVDGSLQWVCLLIQHALVVGLQGGIDHHSPGLIESMGKIQQGLPVDGDEQETAGFGISFQDIHIADKGRGDRQVRFMPIGNHNDKQQQ